MGRRSRVLTARTKNSYLLTRTRMNEPETPGRIMAQIARPPLSIRNHQDSGVCTGTMPTIQ